MVTDYRKNEIVPGVLVAYNRSGEVVLGIVQSVLVHKQSAPYPKRQRYKIKIKAPSKKVSTVTSTNNLVVIRDINGVYTI